MPPNPVLAGFSGSLRAASSSTALLEALAARMIDTVRLERAEIGDLPHYNADLGEPAPVTALKRIVGAADGLIFVTPEYNYSVPGVLKNAIDWLSRPAYASVLRAKPALVISVSAGALGGVRAQAHLKYMLDGMLAETFRWQELVVPNAPAKMVDGRFVDGPTLEFIDAALAPFIAHCRATGRARAG